MPYRSNGHDVARHALHDQGVRAAGGSHGARAEVSTHCDSLEVTPSLPFPPHLNLPSDQMPTPSTQIIRMSIGAERLSNHAASLRTDHINREASAFASMESVRIMARVSEKGFTAKSIGGDDFAWPVLGTKLPTHRRKHVKHWKETHGEPEPML